MQTVIRSMEVDDDDYFESEYRLRVASQVKYIILAPRAFDRDVLSFPLQSLPHLSNNEEWTVAHISRDEPTVTLNIYLEPNTS